MFFSTFASATVVGSGTPSSCTEAALASAIPLGGTITFNCGAGAQSIPFTFTLAVGNSNPRVVIDGGDAVTFDGTGLTDGMIVIFGSATSLPDVTLKHLAVANGNINTGLVAGGAIQNFGRLTLDSVTLRDSHAPGAGAIFQEPCTGCLPPTLVATHSLFQNNSSGSGGAISIQGGNATIEDSTFSGNSASSGGAIEVYGNATFQIDLTIDRCTFSGNSAAFGGGAVTVELLNAGSAVRIRNDTFAGNTAAGAGKGAAIYVGASPVTIANCTIAGNTAPATGGAVYFNANTTAMDNTIVSANSGGNCSFGSGSTFSGGHNLQFGDSTCSGVTVANPLLSPLADNGGQTQTMALGSGSPAIDAADSGLAPATDQRGSARTDGNGDGVVVADIGAFEAAGGSGTPPSTSGRRHVAKH